MTGYDIYNRICALLGCYDLVENKENGIVSGKIPVCEAVISPREAFFAEKKKMPLRDAVGMAAGENIYIYPPGVPVIALGEKIDEKSLEYLSDIRYNIDKEIEVVSL